MAITLSDSEVHALEIALTSYLPGLAFDTARIERPRERHQLVELDMTLRRLLDRIRIDRETMIEPWPMGS